jgi:anti-sigma regulatory factor (Ser/Thr protein kinase)
MTTLRVDATLESLAAIRAFVVRESEAAGLDNRASYRLRLAVDEIVTNIVVHGRPADAGAEATIGLDAVLADDRLTIVVEDRGPAFDPLTLETPEADDLKRPLEQRAIGGLGVFLAIRGVDEFRYERTSGANRNVFVVHRPRQSTTASS